MNFTKALDIFGNDSANLGLEPFNSFLFQLQTNFERKNKSSRQHFPSNWFSFLETIKISLLAFLFSGFFCFFFLPSQFSFCGNEWKRFLFCHHFSPFAINNQLQYGSLLIIITRPCLRWSRHLFFNFLVSFFCVFEMILSFVHEMRWESLRGVQHL